MYFARSGVGLLLAALILAVVAPSRAVDEDPPPDRPYATDHILVELAPGGIASFTHDAEGVFGDWLRVRVPAGRSAPEMVAELADRPEVMSASLDYLIQLDPTGSQPFEEPIAAAFTPNDEFYSYQWHFPPVQAPDAWDQGTGSGVTVAVIDSGISQGGEDLDCHTFVHPYNTLTDTAGPAAASDDNGHGTHVAGTVAQCTNNGVGVAGIAFNASLMPVKVLDANGSGTDSSLAEGIEWARTHGADIINMSLGFDCGVVGWPACSVGIINDAIEAAVADDIVVVAASGNSSQSVVGHPANHPDVIAVGAVDYNLDLTGYSNRGSALSVVAPGGDTSQDVNNDGFVDGVLQETFDSGGWAYHFFQGTSMATPHVAGAAALIRSLAPAATSTEIRQALESTAVDLGPGGFDNQYGHGLIQILDALEYLDVADDTTPPVWSPGALVATAVSGTELQLSWPPAVDNGGVAQYRIYLDGALEKSVAGGVTTANVTGLAPATTYELGVRAIDGAGNQSDLLTALGTTADSIAPQWPAGSVLEVTTYGETRLTLEWSSATDNVGVTGYRLTQAGVNGITSTETNTEITGLQPGTVTIFEVYAQDAAGNESDPLTAALRTARRFLDTPGHVFFGDILWLSGNDITRGCNPPANDRYCPNDPVTRGQMAAFLARALTG